MYTEGMHARIALISILFATSSFAEVVYEDTYCNDPESLEEWISLVERNQDSSEVRKLFSIRTRLCERMKSGDIPVDAAVKQFEDERKRIIKRMYKRIKERYIPNIDRSA